MARGRIFAWSTGVAAALLGLVAAMPLRAQEAPVPRDYPEADSQYAPPETDPVAIERQQQNFAQDLARCDAGELTSCTALSIALRTGNGQPQNRPVAELLFRQACDGGEAQACRELSHLLEFAELSHNKTESAALAGRACALGALPACAEYASYVEEGIGQLGDLAAADDIRRNACAQRDDTSCLALITSLNGPRRSAERREEARAVAAWLCEQGNSSFECEQAKQMFGPVWRTTSAQLRADLRAECDEGNAESCVMLGKEELLTRDGPDEAAITASAIALFDRACTSLQDACGVATALRRTITLDQACKEGRRDACSGLAALYQEKIWAPGDFGKAQALLAQLCDTATRDAERRETCGPSGKLLLGAAESDEPYDMARADALLRRGCEAGDPETCLDLADELKRGKRLPQDRPRAYALLQSQCSSGFRRACAWLENSLSSDPAAPLMEAGEDPAPSATAVRRASMRKSGRKPIAIQRPVCTTTTVILRGIEYTDTICPVVGGVIAGTAVEGGDAPWQALIWRPARLGGRIVPPNSRVLCGGTVIRTGWIMTAAHCLEDVGQDIRTAGHRLRLGVNNPNGHEGISYRILETHPHPGFTGEQPLYWDIALIRYDPASGVRSGPAFPVKTIGTDPKPLNRRTVREAMPAQVYGWGRTEVDGGPIPTSLLRGTVLLRTLRACQEFVQYPTETQNSVLCGDHSNRQQACSGDSGGPVIVFEPGAQGPRTPVLIGVISSGKGCGTKGKPSRFTRVAHPEVQKWMRSVLGGASPPQKAR